MKLTAIIILLDRIIDFAYLFLGEAKRIERARRKRESERLADIEKQIMEGKTK